MERMRILVVEDDSQLRTLYKRFLKRHDAVVVDTAEEAIGYLANEKFDFIVSDYDLRPGMMNGGDFFDWVKMFKPELIEKFIFCSGNDKCQKLHNRVLEKPFDMKLLEQMFQGGV